MDERQDRVEDIADERWDRREDVWDARTDIWDDDRPAGAGLLMGLMIGAAVASVPKGSQPVQASGSQAGSPTYYDPKTGAYYSQQPPPGAPPPAQGAAPPQGGYYVVPAPIGGSLSKLPEGAAALRVEGDLFFYQNGTFYYYNWPIHKCRIFRLS